MLLSAYENLGKYLAADNAFHAALKDGFDVVGSLDSTVSNLHAVAPHLVDHAHKNCRSPGHKVIKWCPKLLVLVTWLVALSNKRSQKSINSIQFPKLANRPVPTFFLVLGLSASVTIPLRLCAWSSPCSFNSDSMPMAREMLALSMGPLAHIMLQTMDRIRNRASAFGSSGWFLVIPSRYIENPLISFFRPFSRTFVFSVSTVVKSVELCPPSLFQETSCVQRRLAYKYESNTSKCTWGCFAQARPPN